MTTVSAPQEHVFALQDQFTTPAGGAEGVLGCIYGTDAALRRAWMPCAAGLSLADHAWSANTRTWSANT